MTRSLGAAYFAAKYAADADPWGLADSWYEQRKYAATVALLPQRCYRSAFEPGCSIGVLSRLLAERCERLLCWDIDPHAVATAGKRLHGRHGVTVAKGAVPDGWPDGRFDLIVISELAYYFAVDDRQRLWTATAQSLAPGGTLIAVHWRPRGTEHVCGGDRVHVELQADPRFLMHGSYVEQEFRADVLTARGGG